MSESPQTTNSAERLISLLKPALTPAPNAPYLQVWRTVFTPVTDLVAIYHNLYLLSELINQIEAEIKSTPNIRHELFLQPFPALRKHVLIDNLTQGSNDFQRDLPAIVNTLEFCSDTLSRVHPEAAIPKSELDELLAGITDLLTLLATTKELNKHLRDILFSLLTAAQISISSYKIKGAQGLRKDLFAIFAIIQVHLDEINASKATPEVSKFDDIMRKFDKFTARALKVKEMFTAAAPLLAYAGNVANQLM